MVTYKKNNGLDSEKLIALPEYILEEFARHELVQELYLTIIGFFPQALHHYRERPDGCDSNILVCCTEGCGWVQQQSGKPLKLSPHTAVIIPAGTPYRCESSSHNPWTVFRFHFKGSQADGFIRMFGLGAGSLELPLSSLVKFNELFEQCDDILLRHPHSYLHHVQLSQTFRYLLSSIAVNASASGKNPRRDRYLEQSIQYMSEHLHTTLTLNDLTKHTGISKPHLIHLFKQAVGYPPIEYFLRLKMQKASQLLDLTHLSIAEISSTLGINDPYYFSRIFKKVMGHSPALYRQLQKG